MKWSSKYSQAIENQTNVFLTKDTVTAENDEDQKYLVNSTAINLHDI